MSRSPAFFRSVVAAAATALLLAACAGPGPFSAGGPQAQGRVSGASWTAGGAGVLLTARGVAWTEANDTIDRSTNGGLTRRRAFDNDARCACFGPAYFLGADDAWDVQSKPGSAPRVWRTGNGGRTWTLGGMLPGARAPGLAGEFQLPDFIDARHGWLLGYGPSLSGAVGLVVALWRTANGGITWQRVGGNKLPEAGRPVQLSAAPGACGSAISLGLTFITPGVGWLTGDTCGGAAPLLWVTRDGGGHWRRVLLPVPAGGWRATGSVQVQAPVFTTSDYGLMPVTTGPGRMIIFRTLNGGERWTPASVVATDSFERPGGLIALSQRQWLLPVSDGLLATEDAGSHWGTIASGVDLAALSAMSVLPDGLGLAQAPSYQPPPDPYGTYRTTDGGASWAPAGTQPWQLGPRSPLQEGVDLTGPGRGLIFGASISTTTDDGARWHVTARTVGGTTSLSFGSATHGVALSTASLDTTSNGGKTWKPGAEPAEGPLNSVQMVSASAGIGTVCAGPTAAQAALVRTSDGGRSWRRMPLPGRVLESSPLGAVGVGPCGAPKGTSACFTSARAGFYVTSADGVPMGFPDSATTLYRTLNAGRTWHVVRRALPPGIVGLSFCAGDVLWSVAGAGEYEGNESPFAILRSTNGGRTWTNILALFRAPLPSLVALDVLSSDDAWVVATSDEHGSAVIMKTTNGGESWTLPEGLTDGHANPVPGIAVVSGVSFSGEMDGWLLAKRMFDSADQVLLATTDGGVTWRRVAT